MKKFTDFCDHNDLYELRPGWVIRKPPWFTDMDMARWRFGPIGGLIPMAGGLVGGAGGLLSGIGGMAGPLMSMLPMAGKIAGPFMGAGAEQEEGKIAEEMAEARSNILLQNAAAIRAQSVEAARIKGEEGRRLLARQKVLQAAANIRMNVGTPLVIEKKTREDIAKDVGFILERGRTGAKYYKSVAAYERALGKLARKKSKWSAITQAMKGFGSIANMGLGGGFGGSGANGSTGGGDGGGWMSGADYTSYGYPMT